MARRKLKQGSGISIDLGAIFGAIAGANGAAPNPDFALAQEAQTAPFVKAGSPTEAALKSGAINRPFAPRNFFGRGAADQANAQYQAREASAGNDVTRALGQAEKMVPIQARSAYESTTSTNLANREGEKLSFPQRLQEKTKFGELENQQYLDREGEMSPILAERDATAKDLAAKLENEKLLLQAKLQYMNANGIPPTEAGFAQADAALREMSIRTAGSKLQQGGNEAELAANEALLRNRALGASGEDIVADLIGRAKLSRNLTDYRTANDSAIGLEEAIKQPLRQREAGITATSNVPVSDNGLFNMGTGRFTIMPRNPLEIGGNPASRIPQYAPQGREVIPGVIDTQGQSTARVPFAPTQGGLPTRSQNRVPLAPQVNDPLGAEFTSLTDRLPPFERTEARRDLFRNLGNEVGLPPEQIGSSTVNKDMADTMMQQLSQHPELAEQFLNYPGRTNLFDTILRKYKLKP